MGGPSEDHAGFPPPAPNFAFLKLPPEIRDCIYRLLLSTRYTYVENDGEPYFKRSPAIWLVNKQIAAEATRVLYKENDFVVLYMSRKCSDSFNLTLVPVFRWLPGKRILNPILRIDIEGLGEEQSTDQIALVTSPEGIIHIVRALLSPVRRSYNQVVYHSMSLTLGFGDNAQLRLEHLKGNGLLLWDKVLGFGKVTICGDIDEATLQHLTEYMRSGPRLDDIARLIDMHQMKAEDCFRHKDYGAARFHWRNLNTYFDFYNRPDVLGYVRCDTSAVTSQHPLKETLAAAERSVKALGLEAVKSYLREGSYEKATLTSHSCSGVSTPFICRNNKDGSTDSYIPVRRSKYLLCVSVAEIMREEHTDRSFLNPKRGYAQGVLNNAVNWMLMSSKYRHRNRDDLTREFNWAIDGYLAEVGSPWKSKWARNPAMLRQNDNSESPPGYRSFWEWLEAPE